MVNQKVCPFKIGLAFGVHPKGFGLTFFYKSDTLRSYKKTFSQQFIGLFIYFFAKYIL